MVTLKSKQLPTNSRVYIEKLLKDKLKLDLKIRPKGECFLPHLKKEYIGLGIGCMGFSPLSMGIENSPLCCNQMAFTLVLSDHPLIMKMLEDDTINLRNFDPEPLRQAQILAEMKIMDLGCGWEPTFARCSREFGADVYTVDKISASHFNYDKKYFSKERRKIEIENHIELDLRDPNAVEIILQHSLGNFDLVTEAHLSSDGFRDGREIGMQLLKNGGIYYRAHANVKVEMHEFLNAINRGMNIF